MRPPSNLPLQLVSSFNPKPFSPPTTLALFCFILFFFSFAERWRFFCSASLQRLLRLSPRRRPTLQPNSPFSTSSTGSSSFYYCCCWWYNWIKQTLILCCEPILILFALGIWRGRVSELRLRRVALPVSRSRGLGRGEVKPRTHTASPKGYVSLWLLFPHWAPSVISCGLFVLTIHFSHVAVHFFCTNQGKRRNRTESLWFFIFSRLIWFVRRYGHCLTFVVLKLGWEFCCVWQLRRERIAERMKALQELVPNANKVNFSCLIFCWLVEVMLSLTMWSFGLIGV